ncbi:Phospholipase/carboxylesterase [Aureobasidium sp. EXF-8845]|nr:Phospholipase/carboxylesterase [Aureobasidium sp. EXF-8845]KAI4844859.1 Phospholipase/carboxylesterase [Aureobasidium sp. EXF-8846]
MWKGKFEETSFIFPNAPEIPISVNMGMRMPGWYDIVRPRNSANPPMIITAYKICNRHILIEFAKQMSFDDIQQHEDEAGITRSQQYVHSLIAKEIEKGIPSERIVLGGFSQGGAMSLMSGVTAPTRLGGIFGLSCYLLLRGKLRDMVPSESPNKQTPIFMGHGDADPVVRYEWGQGTAKVLQEWGWNVDFKTYKGLPHSAAPQEINDLERYIKERIPDLGDKPLPSKA